MLKMLAAGLCLLLVGLKLTDNLDWSWWEISLVPVGYLVGRAVSFGIVGAVAVRREIKRRTPRTSLLHEGHRYR